MACRSIRVLGIVGIVFFLSVRTAAFAQQQVATNSAGTAVPGLVSFSGVLQDGKGQLLQGVVGVTFSLYKDQQGGSPLWTENQNVQPDAQGRFNVLLGATQQGLPVELFGSGEPRWLGVQVQIPGEAEEPRVLLVSVPYAMKAADADTIGGRPASAFVLASSNGVGGTSEGEQPRNVAAGTNGPAVFAATGTGTAGQLAKWTDNNGTLGNSILTDTGSQVGLNNATPSVALDVSGTIRAVLGPGAPFGTYLLPTGGAANDFRFGFGNNLFFDGTNWRTKGDGVNNAGSGLLTDIGKGAVSVYTFPSTGGTDQIIPNSALGNNERMRIAGDGSVGIGTSTPATTLDVSGTLRSVLSPGAPFGAYLIPDNASNGFRFGLGNNLYFDVAANAWRTKGDGANNGGAGVLTNIGNGSLSLFTVPVTGPTDQVISNTNFNAFEKVRITGDGSVGIGITSPAAKLDVNGTARATSFVGDGSQLTNVPAATAVNCATPCISTSEIQTGAVTSAQIALGTIVDANINPLANIQPQKIAGTAATLGANTFGGTQTIASGNLALPATTSASSGVVTVGGTPFLHSFGLENTYVGANAGVPFPIPHASPSNNTGIGSGALSNNAEGSENTAIGFRALFNNFQGNLNTGFGYLALSGNFNAPANTAVGANTMVSGSGPFNTAVGESALRNSTGSMNTAIGQGALANLDGSQNTALGVSAGFTEGAKTTGSNNTFIGFQAGSGTPTQLTNATAIGANALVSANDTLVLGSPDISVAIGASTAATKLQVVGDIRVGTSGNNGCIQGFGGSPIAGTCSSDARLKQNIEPFAAVLDKVIQLQPVSYDWNGDAHPEYHFGNERTAGLIAQEVEKVFPDMVTTDQRGFKAVNYSQLPLLLLQAVRELKTEKDQQQATIERLLSDVEQLKAQLAGNSTTQ